ncbi:RagB/SusD family nutrient uptake outer membrane protein [Mucilaginibacter gracilis]|uniref:RagB/SusD family nutrient uptake outer membrane protein n=1 Tax=Mucilaginibacter gracilis TaxID=423350 RepID=UPI000EB17D3A|nr:RagB/SusD family nutrient uptake outer membrane protein [Mucilaginibacter gracilis]
MIAYETASTIYQGTPYYYFSKYKQKLTNTTATGEYVTYLRLAEQYLIRAEARAKQGNLAGAIADINVIRTRAGLLNTTAVLQPDILLAIEQERRIELFGEYGHRWNDLRRTGRANAVLGALKTTWTANAALYPIPKTEIQNNSNLTQNPGY